MSEHDGDMLRSLFAGSSETVLVDVLRREIWIDGDIDEHVSRDVIRGLRHLVQLSRHPIDVMVNSNGGSLSDGLAVADYLRLLSSDNLVVSTKVMGVAYSAGALIACCGTKGHRYALPSSRFLIHQLSASGVDGKMEDLQSDVKNLEELNARMVIMLSEITGKLVHRVGRDLKQESFMSVDEAISYGLVDHKMKVRN